MTLHMHIFKRSHVVTQMYKCVNSMENSTSDVFFLLLLFLQLKESHTGLIFFNIYIFSFHFYLFVTFSNIVLVSVMSVKYFYLALIYLHSF